MSTGVASEEPWTVKRILDWTISFLKEKGSESPRLDAEVLLAHSRKCHRIQLYTQFDQPLTDEQRATMRDLVKRRAAHEPVAYLVGHKDFFSLDFIVRPGVFIPRPDTEILVMATLDALKEVPAPAAVLELCAGSGCVPISIAKNLTSAQVTTVEKNPDVAKITQENIDKHAVGDRVQLLIGDLFTPVPKGKLFDVVTSNPPYVQRAEIAELAPDIRDHEPHLALDGGPDGLDVIRRLAAQSPEYLKPGGWLMFELSPEQAQDGMQILNEAGYTEVGVKNDLSGQARVVVGRKPK
ncbi:peptide chain release factor N(5)-glutamine methyltransferase [Planctomicrobium sp. SH527]|uniref:peptide chain release factor N(5)-glutamine methyltransferase n=1 Tax=Planctomicrobium sp. SH527 TaxID=3448123 RepID=UPI003F5BD407